MAPNTTTSRILEAARVVGKSEGIEPTVTSVIKEAGVSNRTFYRHFETQRELYCAIARKQARDVLDDAIEIERIPDADDALREWMQCGFAMVAEYGQAALQIALGRLPSYIAEEIDTELLHRFTGRLLKRWKAQGYAQEDFEVRRAVRMWFALVSNERISGDLADGHNILDIYQDTCRVFWAAYGRAPVPVEDVD